MTESFEELPILSPYKDEGLSLISRSNDLCKDRDTIIHSVIMEYKPGAIKLTKYHYNEQDRKENKPRIVRSEYTINHLLEYGKKIQDLQFELGPFVVRLLADLSRSEFD